MDYLNTVTINQTRNFIGGTALHPRRCRRAHRGDGVSDGPARFTRGRHTTHVHRMRLLSRPPTSDPHTPPSPTVSETSAIRTCGRHIMRLLSRPPSTVLRSALVLHLLTFVVHALAARLSVRTICRPHVLRGVAARHASPRPGELRSANRLGQSWWRGARAAARKTSAPGLLGRPPSTQGLVC